MPSSTPRSRASRGMHGHGFGGATATAPCARRQPPPNGPITPGPMARQLTPCSSAVGRLHRRAGTNRVPARRLRPGEHNDEQTQHDDGPPLRRRNGASRRYALTLRPIAPRIPGSAAALRRQLLQPAGELGGGQGVPSEQLRRGELRGSLVHTRRVLRPGDGAATGAAMTAALEVAHVQLPGSH